jgi:hypothetical protein
MKTELREAMTSGVLVEFQDAQGNLLGQVVYTDWRGRPVPGLGDTLASPANAAQQADPVTLRGRVVSRHFQLQADEDGAPCVWVRLVVAVPSKTASRPKGSLRGICFSQN